MSIVISIKKEHSYLGLTLISGLSIMVYVLRKCIMCIINVLSKNLFKTLNNLSTKKSVYPFFVFVFLFLFYYIYIKDRTVRLVRLTRFADCFETLFGVDGIFV